MTTRVNPIPEGFHTVTPYLSCADAAGAIAFYRRAFGATEERARLTAPDGRVMNAEVAIGDSVFMIAEEAPELGTRSPQAVGSTSVVIVLHVADVDALFSRAVAAGAEVLIPLSNQFYGDRTGRLRDPFGHIWILSTHVEEVPDAVMVERFEALFGG